MPIHIKPAPDASVLSRREALARLAAGAGAGALALGFGSTATSAAAAPRQAPASAWYAWLADTHIAADAKTVLRENNMAANLRKAVASVLDQPGDPRALFVDGDLALLDGQPGDYGTFLSLLNPIRKADVPIYVALGNHDDRESIRVAYGLEMPIDPDVADRWITVLDEPAVRFVLLDSLQKPNHTPGLVGARQLAWLGRTLDADAKKPTVVFVHHNLSDAAGALNDTAELLAVLGPRTQVKAVVYGHSHRWEAKKDVDGLHLINLPAIAYPFGPDQPLGWVRFEPTSDGASLTLHAIGGNMEKDRERIDLTWRG
jgi:3',5'-cyclic AMP phosphodiesterase CpdA